MTTDNKQSVLTDDFLKLTWDSINTSYGREPFRCSHHDFARAIEQAVLSKLRGADEPSDKEIESLALDCGFNKSNEHWGDRYYTELGTHLFGFALALLARYAAPQTSAEVRNAALEEAGRTLDRLHDENRQYHTVFRHAANAVRAMKSAPAAEDVDQQAADRLETRANACGTGVDQDGVKGAWNTDEGICWSSKEIQRRQREEDEARAAFFADRQKRGGDVSSLREALRWTAACLLAYTDGSEGESFRMTETGETRLISEVLDMADAALAPPEQIN